MEYLIIEAVLILITYLIHKYYNVKIFKSKKQMSIFWILIFFGGIVWDNYAVYRGHWFYPGTGTIGINIGLIPFEDYIFMFLVGYGFLVLYTVSNKLTDEYWAKRKRTK
jgi:lycopene cyclase domain-containing protein